MKLNVSNVVVYCFESSLAAVAEYIGCRRVECVPYGISAQEELNGLDSREDQQNININFELTK